MLWYVAIVALLNLALGYLWGAYVRPCPRCAKARAMGLSLLPTSSVLLESEYQAGPLSAPIAAAGAPATYAVDEPGSHAADESPGTDALLSAESARPSVPRDSAAILVTLEEAEQLLTQLTADEAPLTVALVEMAPIDWIGEQPNRAIDQRLFCGVSTIVRQLLAQDHTVARYTDQQLLLLVPREDVQQATRRAEDLRQRVAATEFVADGRAFQTTVTCALAEVTDRETGPKLFEFLQEALDEAKRYGGNRTFMHDGRSPTPVVPAELPVMPRQLAI